MKGVYSIPYLPLDNLVPLHILDLEEIELELATSQRKHNLWGPISKNDFSYFRTPPEGSSERVKQFYEDYKDDQHTLQLYAKLAYQCYSPTVTVRVSELLDTAHPNLMSIVDNSSKWKRNYNIFKSVNKFIDECEVFESTGRIIFFINEHKCNIPVHSDYFHKNSNRMTGFNAEAEKEFLWISLRKLKNFFIFDEKLNVRHDVVHSCIWFNTLDMHGGDAIDAQSWSLRIDGKFSSKFRKILDNNFKT